jgi:hypothetical protein
VGLRKPYPFECRKVLEENVGYISEWNSLEQKYLLSYLIALYIAYQEAPRDLENLIWPD